MKALEVLPNPPTAPRGEDWSDRISLTFSIGVYVALNAIRDAYLLVDAPDCAHLKTQYLQGNHDWFSTITSTSGFHRVANTDLHPWKMVASRDAAIEALLERIASHPPVGCAMITSLPMATITGLDYDRVTRRVAAKTGKPVVNVPGDGLNGDWLDGYAATLKSLARSLPLEGGGARPGAIGVVGYLMDRNEGDHRANLDELQRVVEGLGLSVASVWLSGGSVADLLRIREASVIVSMPYAREAARIVAQRLGVPLVEADLPVGFAATERWIRQVGEATGTAERVQSVLDAELGRAVPRVEWIVPYHLLHRRIVFVGDPHLGLAIGELAEELGMSMAHYFVLNRKAHAKTLIARAGALPVTCDPKRDEMNRLLFPLLSEGGGDVLVTNSLCVSPGAQQAATVELGFPSFYTHALEDRPFLFARGTVVLVERIMNELRRAELAAAV
jgi:nitrogenase molybdenum-iron protein alpha/beta subunit